MYLHMIPLTPDHPARSEMYNKVAKVAKRSEILKMIYRSERSKANASKKSGAIE
jgi:hypothetical protein